MRVAVTGHRGLSATVEALIGNEIDRELDRVTATGAELTGLSCLADGADQIFAAAILAHGGALEAVVPAVEYRTGLPDSAKARYDSLFASARTVHRCPFRESNSEAHMAASRFMVDEAERLIAVWDGEPARAFGGTADVVAYARDKGCPITVVWPAGATR
jgi:hypothetical protein